MLKGRVAWRIVTTTVVFGFLPGCTAKPSPSPLLLEPPPPSLTSQWTWGKVPTKVATFENDVGIRVMLQTKNGEHTPNLLGRGLSQQLASALAHSTAFEILADQSTQDEMEAQEAEGEMDIEVADQSAEESTAAQLQISGTLLAYALSPSSVADGIYEDPLLRELADDPSADSTFQQLIERAKGTNEDKISIELRLMDAQAKNEISAMAFHCAPADWESPLKGRFDDSLRPTITPPRTPIQKAMEACLIKIANWTGDKYDSWKKNPEQFPNYRKVQQALNTLGYHCGEIDGKRGEKTEACIQQFLSDKGIGEKDLESTIAEELELFSSTY